MNVINSHLFFFLFHTIIIVIKVQAQIIVTAQIIATVGNVTAPIPFEPENKITLN